MAAKRRAEEKRRRGGIPSVVANLHPSRGPLYSATEDMFYSSVFFFTWATCLCFFLPDNGHVTARMFCYILRAYLLST